MWIRQLDRAECMGLIEASRVGCLACCKDGQPYVVPIHFACADTHLYAFSLVGKKIEWMRANPLVSVLVEEQGGGCEWRSVVGDGRYEELPDRVGYKVQRDRAWLLLSKHAHWWEPGGLKPVLPPPSDHSDHVFFRINIERISGREATEKQS